MYGDRGKSRGRDRRTSGDSTDVDPCLALVVSVRTGPLSPEVVGEVHGPWVVFRRSRVSSRGLRVWGPLVRGYDFRFLLATTPVSESTSYLPEPLQ